MQIKSSCTELILNNIYFFMTFRHRNSHSIFLFRESSEFIGITLFVNACNNHVQPRYQTMPCMTEISNKAEISENVCDDRDITRLRYQTMSVIMAEMSDNEFVVIEISDNVRDG